MTTPLFRVIPVPLPASPEHISSYASIRLTALSTNPETFGSSFGRESAFTPEIWRLRVNTKERTTLAAIKNATEGQWVGTLSVLWPELLLKDSKGRLSYPPQIKEAEDSGLVDVFMLVGMWVHPDYRKLGVGRALIEHALEIVKSHSSEESEKENVERRRTVLLEVCKDNETAIKLYGKAGFSKQHRGEVEDENTEIEWMARTVN
ncbi:acyl-CoA N-acyltransferase [Gymnopilus junonius]|uniref:Acyl-CoA N-acyltransferase n=1 Tax=Gymnopilus junonius TaxID=109634 RepID=A0A9P5NEC2_GYMJU|nr:acyl-CoA N-acyltransferase [Gymnopilus junonius]